MDNNCLFIYCHAARMGEAVMPNWQEGNTWETWEYGEHNINVVKNRVGCEDVGKFQLAHGCFKWAANEYDKQMLVLIKIG